MSKYRYKVTKDCFYGGCYRTPGGRHGIVVVPEKLNEDEKPSYLELIDDAPAAAPSAEPEKINASKNAVELAEQFSVNLDDVVGTGANGQINKGDVQKFIDDNTDNGDEVI